MDFLLSGDSTILQKMKLDIDQINQVKPTENGMELFKLVAARFVSSFSIVQKNCRTFEAGFKEGSKQLNDVHNSMDLAFQERLVEGDSINASYIFEKLGPGKKIKQSCSVKTS